MITPEVTPASHAAPAATKIAVKNLDFYYGKFHALKNINLEIPERKVTAFIGPVSYTHLTLPTSDLV